MILGCTDWTDSFNYLIFKQHLKYDIWAEKCFFAQGLYQKPIQYSYGHYMMPLQHSESIFPVKEMIIPKLLG